jgi:hypothetical protein
MRHKATAVHLADRRGVWLDAGSGDTTPQTLMSLWRPRGQRYMSDDRWEFILWLLIVVALAVFGLHWIWVNYGG